MMEPITPTNFYQTLCFYQPLCYRGKGAPIFMTNTGWRGSFYCVLLINVLVIAVCIMLALDRTVPQFTAADEAAASRLLLLLIDGVLLFLVDLTYFLTQFLNPGIIDPTYIPEEVFEYEGRYFCSECNRFRTGQMDHCAYCRICVYDLDHHCGFFAKCIAGKQKFAFFAFLTLSFCVFMAALVTASYSLPIV